MYELKFLADENFMEMVAEMRSLTSGRSRDQFDMSGLLKIAMGEFIERHSPVARERRRKERKQRKERKETGRQHEMPEAKSGVRLPAKKGQIRQGNVHRSRNIPQAVRDRVWIRDKGRCTFM